MALLVLSFCVFFVANADDNFQSGVESYYDNFESRNNSSQFGGDDVIQAASYSDGAVFRETFQASNNTNYNFNGNGVIQAYSNGRILRASYPPTSEGSPRLSHKGGLARSVSEATLSFDMKFHSEFEFVKGGKMHGLGGGTGTTGCKPIDPNGWSVRMMWARNGVPQLYIYHQNRANNCGDVYPASNFAFKLGSWYRIDIQVRMNTAVGSGNGYVALYIDGVLRSEARNLNLTGKTSVQIDHFKFSTFYGGSDSSWSPSKTTYCYFDNFSVMPGRIVTGTKGTECEIFKNGIYSTGSNICCAVGCGSCGGSGCGSLPGGGSQCCSGSITKSCSTSSSPCMY